MGKKTADAQRARELQYLQGSGQTAEEEATLIVKNEALDNCKEKCQLMSKLVYKAAYSRPIQYKRHIINQHKLNEFLGRSLLEEKDDESEKESEFTQFDRIANSRVTYAELLQRIEHAERNYGETRGKQLGKKAAVADNRSETAPASVKGSTR